jgi:hypothetical protein
LRKAWLKASDSEVCEEIDAKIQERAFETVPYIPTGQYLPKTAYRKNLRGVIKAPALFMWNAEKVELDRLLRRGDGTNAAHELPGRAGSQRHASGWRCS